MKQMLVLEAPDLAALREGQVLTVTVGDTQVMLSLANAGVVGVHDRRPSKSSRHDALEHECKTCHMKFGSAQGMSMHRWRVHRKKNGKSSTKKGRK